MTRQKMLRGRVLAVLLAATLAVVVAAAQSTGATMQHAKGTFDVKMTPIPAAPDDKSGIARMSIDKQFHGDLDGHSVGEMLSAGDPRKAAGYVAMEVFTGTLHGKTGSFALQHNGTINNGAQTLSIEVVPGSGTGGLVGITGKFNLVIEAGKHSYDLEYSLPETK